MKNHPSMMNPVQMQKMPSQLGPALGNRSLTPNLLVDHRPGDNQILCSPPHLGAQIMSRPRASFTPLQNNNYFNHQDSFLVFPQ
jgi:hypothetical protein